MLKLPNHKTQSIISIFSLSCLSMLLLGFVFSSAFTLNNNAYADASSDTIVQLYVDSFINISTPNTATLACSSDTSGTNNGGYVCNTTTNIAVSTNNATGYTLYMNATSGYSNSLTHATVGSATPTIPTLSQAYPSANFPINHWGYTGGSDQSSITGGYNCSTNYCPILAYNSDSTAYAPNHVIKTTSAPAISTIPITYLAKADNVKESGEYSTSLTYTAITNYIPSVSITTGMTMQQVDSAICANTQPYSVTHQIYTLSDARDDTKYTVAKLADGNCWMTQNLELGEYGSPMTLTNQLSNVGPSGYTLTLPYENNSIYKGNENKYGNYYNWSQATAGSGTTTAGEDALYSVCPKNWRLPKAGNAATSANNEFYTLLNNNYITTGKWDSNNNRWNNVVTSQFTNEPTSFVFSGYMSSAILHGQGEYGYRWSSTSSGPTDAFVLSTILDGRVYPRESLGVLGSFSVRCLVPGS